MPDSINIIESLYSSVIQTTNIMLASQLLMGVGLGILLCLGILLFLRFRRINVKTVTVALPFSLGNITYELTDQSRVIAWKMYVQLKTRKAALPFDKDSDVIIEVYDSLYELFPIVRDLLSQLPLKEIKRKESVADLLIRVQNFGLRPHLTKWQSDFRKWWQLAMSIKANKDRSPQQIQADYPKYVELVEDLQRMNVELNSYADSLLLIARQKKAPKPRKVKPVPPTQTSSTDNKPSA